MTARKIRRQIGAALLALCPAITLADGNSIDRVYHPYVDALAWELEWRTTHQKEDPLNGEQKRQLHRLGLGRAVGEYVFAELYLVGERSEDESLSLDAYEAEIKWQLTEQGEYSIDYGLLFELEREREEDIWEYTTMLLLEKEFGRFSAAANLGLIYEWGDDIDNEFETSLATQVRYRYSPRLEPAIELYLSEDTTGLGPVLMGMERLGLMRSLSWEIGAIIGMDSDTSDYTLRGLIEYEF